MHEEIRILMIEDDEEDAFILKKIIQKIPDCDFTLIHTTTLAEGRNKLKEEYFDLIFLDLNLPDSNGIVTYYTIKNAYPVYPVIILTGLSDEDLALHAIKEGAMDYIPKSEVDRNNLKRIVYYAIERKKLEQELEKKNELLLNTTDELERKNNELNKLTFTITNDLLSPILSIKGFIDMIREHIAANKIDEVIKNTELINNTTEKMHILIENLSDLIKIGTEKLSIKKLSVESLVKEELEVLRGKYDIDACTITIEPNMPDIIADRSRMMQVIEQLLDNAFKFMGAQKHPEITIGCKKEGKRNIYFVRDNGIGIAPGYPDFIFNLFYRIDQQKTGSGIGLSIASKIIEEHYGKLWAESDGEGCGSTFYFTINDLMNNLK